MARPVTGMFDYISAESYHSDMAGDPRHDGTPSLSASLAHVLLSRSPKHAWQAHPRLNPNFERKDDGKFDVGKVCHQLILEGNANVVVVEANDWKTKAAQLARDEAYAHYMTPLLSKHYDQALEMCEAVSAQLAELDLEPLPFTGGKPEVTIVWNEPNGVACRSRIDYLTDDHGWIFDLKTTSRSARGEVWTRGALYDHGCDIQASFYRRGVEALTGVLPEWRWVVVETAPPYALQVIRPGNDLLAFGERRVEKALELWSECLSSDVWPAYSREVFEAELPAFVEMRWLEREAREAA